MSQHDPDRLRARVAELEALCIDVYVAAVELGLPQPLLERLWNVAGAGNSPQAFAFDLPPRPGPADAVAANPAEDRRASDRAVSRDRQQSAARPALKELTTRRTVLVVDDDPLMLEVLKRILRRENYALLSAGGGVEALAKAAEHDGAIDLLITDCEMPGLKGPELADKMRERYPGIKVLYQTGFSDMLFEPRPVLDEDSAFLEKPFTARGLSEAARLVLFGALNP